MSRFTKESVQRLRDAVDIIDLISRYVPLKKAGVTYKACCPFHDEKSPSFTVNKVSRHYHCFGCGAHGDAVSFLMNYERLNFLQALEFLSERVGIPLEIEHEEKSWGVSKGRLKLVLESASHFFHTLLLFSEEASEARDYLLKRGFSLQFLEAFCIGYAPRAQGVLRVYLHAQGFIDKEMEEAGLLSNHDGRRREFFSERITFPILDVMGSTIGFSARKWKEETYGGKYINTPETILFKKSRVLFGLFYSKKRMAKERVALIVEGQLDALRLIEAGFDFTVATLGTAFGAAHVEQLRAIGVEEVYLAFDQDEAGQTSAEKGGDLLMKHGVDVHVVSYSEVKDPDEFLSKFGSTKFFQVLTESIDYLQFAVDRAKKHYNFASPVEKDRAIRGVAEKIYAWDNSVMRHESLKQLARLADVPESLLERQESPSIVTSIPEKQVVGGEYESADRARELDLLRWLTLAEKDREEIFQICEKNLFVDDFSTDIAKEFFSFIMKNFKEGRNVDFLHFAEAFDTEIISPFLTVLLSKKQLPEKLIPVISEAILKIREKKWLFAREEIHQKMSEPGKGDGELLELAKQFDSISKQIPKIQL